MLGHFSRIYELSILFGERVMVLKIVEKRIFLEQHMIFTQPLFTTKFINGTDKKNLNMKELHSGYFLLFDLQFLYIWLWYLLFQI